MPDYTRMSTSSLIFLLRKWEEENRRKPSRKNMAKIKDIKAAMAKAQNRGA